MNWIHFILWIAGIYALYYLAVILFDVSRSGRSPTEKSLSNELTFSDPIQPKRMEHEPEDIAPKTVKAKVASVAKATVDSPVVASGGVLIKDLFSLARQEAIIYTRPVSF